jgi:aspartate-semialdehyde dehydrogenase
MPKKIDVAVLGATSPVGEAMLEHLSERDFPLGKLYLLSPSLSVGEEITIAGRDIVIQDAEQFDFSKVSIALFAAGADAAVHYAPRATAAGCVVIDSSPQFRLDTEVPLVVADVNPESIAGYLPRRLIASPNAATVHLLRALKPIHDAVGITRINVVTLQSVSGSGKEAINELADQTRAIFNLSETENSVYPKRIAFNLLPQIGAFLDSGYTAEEMKIVQETQRVLGDGTMAINPTSVRVPVFYGHAQALHIETHGKIDEVTARNLLKNQPGVTVIDEREDGSFPTPLDAAAQDDVLIGRIRADISHPNGLNMWIVADNIRAGSALNCVNIAEIFIEKYLK